MTTIQRLILVGLIATAGQATGDQQAQSIMFNVNEPPSELTSKPDADEARAERCAKLSREVEALKGKPQRRYAAAQRYEAECQR